MIVIPIWLYPRGDSSRKRRLYHFEIVNDTTGNEQIGNYDITVYSSGEKPSILWSFRIEEHERQDVLGLIEEALRRTKEFTNG